jgi:hypothetical protein
MGNVSTVTDGGPGTRRPTRNYNLSGACKTKKLGMPSSENTVSTRRRSD